RAALARGTDEDDAEGPEPQAETLSAAVTSARAGIGTGKRFTPDTLTTAMASASAPPQFLSPRRGPRKALISFPAAPRRALIPAEGHHIHDPVCRARGHRP